MRQETGTLLLREKPKESEEADHKHHHDEKLEPSIKTSSLRSRATPEEISIEVTRKSIHLLIALTPSLLAFSRTFTIALLAAGTLAYSIFEALRLRGIWIPLVSWLTSKAARLRDNGNFVTGPVTLGLGALFSVLIFPPMQASIAIYILAFGDGFSSLVGKAFGRITLPLTDGKSLEGSLTCFLTSFLSSYLVCGQLFASIGIALAATAVEAAPTKDWDNIILPLTAGVMAVILL